MSLQQFQSLQTVNMTKQQQTLVLQRQQLLQQVERVIEALQMHIAAVDSGSPVDKHASNVNLATQCNFLNAQVSLAKGREDQKGLQIGLKTTFDRVEELRAQPNARSQSAQDVIQNYSGYMTAVLRGDTTAPLPSVEVTAGDKFDSVGNGVFGGFLGSYHDSERRTRDMERNIEAVRARQESSFSSAAMFEPSPDAGSFDVSRMTGYMRGRVTGYTGARKPAGSRAVVSHGHVDSPPDLCGEQKEDIEMVDKTIVAGTFVRALANGRMYRVSRVDMQRKLVFVEDREQGRLIRLRVTDVQPC